MLIGFSLWVIISEPFLTSWSGMTTQQILGMAVSNMGKRIGKPEYVFGIPNFATMVMEKLHTNMLSHSHI